MAQDLLVMVILVVNLHLFRWIVIFVSYLSPLFSSNVFLIAHQRLFFNVVQVYLSLKRSRSN